MILSDDYIFIIIIAAPILAFLIIIGCIAYFCRYGIDSRYKSAHIRGTLRYFKQIVVVPEVFEDLPKKLTKRERRRLKLRQFYVQQRDKRQRERDLEGQEDEDEEEEDPAVEVDDEGNNVLDRIMKSFKAISPSRKSKKVKGKSEKLSSASTRFFSWLISTKENTEKPKQETVTKAKRFISQDRLQRAEARKLLFKAKSAKIFDIEQAIEAKTENVTSLLDMNDLITDKQQEIIAKRKAMHAQRVAQLKADNPDYIDMVQLNGGPLPHQIPKGYRVVHFIPDNKPETLLWKRILYLWEGEHLQVQGWYLGTIGSESKQPGSNYNVKYNRAETGSLFVDGFHAVDLALAGSEAYGRRWVIVEKINEGKGSKSVTSPVSPSRITAVKENSNNTSSSADRMMNASPTIGLVRSPSDTIELLVDEEVRIG